VLRLAAALDRARNRGRGWSFQWARSDDAERDHVPFTRRVLSELALAPGERVVDLGAGAGYFTLRAARLVESHGRVLAADREWSACLHVWVQKERRGLENVEVRWVHPYRPALGQGDIDAILMVNAFAFREGRDHRSRALLSRLASALRPGGRLIIAADAVHTRAWRPSFGTGRSRNDLDGEAVAALASPLLTPTMHERLVTGPPEVGKGPGFILRLERSPRRDGPVAYGEAQEREPQNADRTSEP
jgi:precorrin-6B methylase 2